MFQKVIGKSTSEPSPSSSTPIQPTPASPSPINPGHLGGNPSSASSAPAPVRATAAASRNVLSTDVEVKGILRFTNDLIVDGRIEGEIHSDGNLTIGENARIKAEIRTATVIIHGKVHGNITATDRVDLKAGAEIVGDIKSKVLSMEAGAVFVGKSTIGASAPAGNTPASAPAPAPVAKTAEKA